MLAYESPAEMSRVCVRPPAVTLTWVPTGIAVPGASQTTVSHAPAALSLRRSTGGSSRTDRRMSSRPSSSKSPTARPRWACFAAKPGPASALASRKSAPGPAPSVLQQRRPLAVVADDLGMPVDLRVDVAVGDHQVEIAVVVEVGERRAPGERAVGDRPHAGLDGSRRRRSRRPAPCTASRSPRRSWSRTGRATRRRPRRRWRSPCWPAPRRSRRRRRTMITPTSLKRPPPSLR